MEEQIGALWHRLITRATQRHYPDAAVTLAEIEKTAGLLFSRSAATPVCALRPRRPWLARIAGLGEKAELRLVEMPKPCNYRHNWPCCHARN